MPNDKKKNKIIPKFNKKQPLHQIQDKYVEILVSIGNGLNGGKKIDSEEILAEKVLQEIKKYHPKHIIIHLADFLQRWNLPDMVSLISNAELKTRLADLPPQIDERQFAFLFAQKFADLATHLGTQYMNNLQKYFEEKKITAELDIPFTIKCWKDRKTTNNFKERKLTQFDSMIDNLHKQNNLKNKISATTQRFLKNKRNKLETFEARIKTVQPNLSHLNFSKITNIACEEYIKEEFKYFYCLENTDIIYPAKIPPALEPIFEKKELKLCWREVEFKKRSIKKMQDELHKLQQTMKNNTCDNLRQRLATDNAEPYTFISADNVHVLDLKRTQSVVSLDQNNNKTSPNYSFLGRRHNFFVQPVATNKMADENVTTPLSETKSNNTIRMSNKSWGGPKSEEKLVTFINLFCKSPLTPEKDLALQRKLDEATALLSLNS